tara:strand:- start:287 stop:1933 length:1647 start_codon:yes stop_codon:yes gene_type:complete
VATPNLKIRLDAIDNTKKAFGSLRGSLFNLKTLIASIGVGVAIKEFISVGRSVEDLQVRLKQLFGSTQEGSKAFDVMARFAGRVPFSLEEIQAASGNLAVVAGNADNLAEILEITGNVAAVTGLDFRTAGEQIQRSFAGGIAAADIFREKGVRDMLGFKAGATVTAEETIKAFQKTFGKGGRFGNATDELATTFTGTLSMIGDKLFNFKRTVAGAQFFDALKAETESLNKFLEDNEIALERVANAIGVVLTGAINIIGGAIRKIGDAVNFVEDQVDNLIQLLNKIPGVNIDLVTRFEQEFMDFFTKYDREMENQKRKNGEIGSGLLENKTILQLTTEELKKVNDKFRIEAEIVKTIQGGVKSVSRSLAEAVILGKNLNETLANLARQLLVNILASVIERIALMYIEKFLQKIINKDTEDKLNKEKKITSEKKKQAALQAIIAALGGGGGGGGFFGFAEGGQVKARADGGGVGRGAPYMVGERGRELFVPNQDGEIVSNERLQNLGATVNFTINATDVKGVKELLIDNRATIVNIINGALNQKGKQALV